MHTKVAIGISICLIIVIGAITYYNFSLEEIQPVVGKDYCETDADCVPSSCCHPTQCTGRANAPQCADVICTAACVSGSMDCGAGYCGCINNRCSAVLG